MTVREEMDQAYWFYNKGNWNRASEVLDEMRSTSKQETMEALALYGWIYWKEGAKSNAAYYWTIVSNSKKVPDAIKSSAYAGLGIYYAKEGNKEEALKYIQLAQNILPEDATIQQVKFLNSLGITTATTGELSEAEKIFSKVAYMNQQLEKSDDPVIAEEGKHQRAKNGYNLVSLILIPQERFYEAIKELEEEVIPRYEAVGAETDLAAAYHRVSEVNEKIAEADEISDSVKLAALELSLAAEYKSLGLWKKHQEDAPGRVETAQKNIKRIKDKTGEQE